MKKLTFLFAAMLAVSTAFAQISTGEPHSSVIPRTGNRPQAGDFGLYVGASVTQIIDFVKLNKNKDFTENAFWALPAINLKYYFTDNWEGRIGFQFACKGTTEKFTPKGADWIKNTSDINYTRFLPGFAYHFNTKNIVDVYVGAQMPIGFNLIQRKGATDGYSVTEKNNQFVIGGGVFFGGAGGFGLGEVVGVVGSAVARGYLLAVAGGGEAGGVASLVGLDGDCGGLTDGVVDGESNGLNHGVVDGFIVGLLRHGLAASATR